MNGDIGIGKIIEIERYRDAIHIAVAPVMARERLVPGQHVGITAPGEAGPSEHPIGIVDPYLMRNVQPGQQFYVFLYPGSITSLRHDWNHPAFIPPAPVPGEESRAWIERFADDLDISYTVLMDAAKKWVDFQDYHIFHGINTPEVVFSKMDQFWEHYEKVTGTKVDKKESFFSCAC